MNWEEKLTFAFDWLDAKAEKVAPFVIVGSAVYIAAHIAIALLKWL